LLHRLAQGEWIERPLEGLAQRLALLLQGLKLLLQLLGLRRKRSWATSCPATTTATTTTAAATTTASTAAKAESLLQIALQPLKLLSKLS
jgi:hypothetical protein